MSFPPERRAARTPERRSRFVTLCQQLLALGLVVAALTPAARIVSLEVVPQGPAGGGAASARGAAQGEFAAYLAANQKPSRVPTAPVEAKVTEVSLTTPEGVSARTGVVARTQATPEGGSAITSAPQPVTGYGAVGVSWGHGQQVADDAISVQVRLDEGAGWSDWMPVEYHAEHGPDPDSAEGQQARIGTDALLVGEVDQVQVKIETDGAAPSDMKLAVIDPGVEAATEMEAPAIDTGAGDAPATQLPAGTPAVPADTQGLEPVEQDALELQRAVYTPKPTIYSRAQWGADERMRSASSLRYFEIHGGFVHHTVNANNYTRAQVPGILRSIYAYHTRSLGWSDVGYNFLVDRFGRIWEGRAGGVDRPVVGAHTLGYNDDSFAMSAIGNFEVAQPSAAMIQAYGALFAWKLSMHGVNAASKKQFITSRNFQAISGHRDAGSTACPGIYLYNKIPEIRRLAAQGQKGFTGRQLESNLASGPLPDLVARRASDGNAIVLPLQKKKDGAFKLGKAIDTGRSVAMANRIMNAGDWDRDGRSDIMFRHKGNGALYLYRGNGKGGVIDGPHRIGLGFGKVGLLAAVGDVTGDGWPDLMGKPSGSATMRIYPGVGLNGFRASYVGYGNVQGNRQVPVGLWDGDGAPDTMVRKGAALTLYRGNGPGGLVGSRAVPLNVGGFDWVVGISDVRLTGHPDLVVRSKTDKRLYLVEGTATSFAAPVLLGGGSALGAYNMVG